MTEGHSGTGPSRIRVLRVIGRMNVGGPALQVAAITGGLDPERFESRLLVGRVEHGEADYLQLRAPNVSAHPVDGLGRSPSLFKDARALAGVGREIRRFEPHIVHTHTAKAGALGRLAARWCDVPVVVHTFHGHLLHGYFSPAVTSAVVQAERALARLSTRLVSVGTRVRDDLLAAGIGRPEQFVCVPPGVEIPSPPDRALARRILGLPATGAVVCYVARLTSIKRPERFVEVAARLAERHRDATFVIAGEGPRLEELRAGAARLRAPVRFLGWRADVEVVYAASDVVVLTSDNEGMPVSLIEAAMVGRPAVSTNVGSVPEVIVDGVTGLLSQSSSAEIAVAVDRLLADPMLRAAMGAAATRRAVECFSRRRLVDDTERLYLDLAASRHFP